MQMSFVATDAATVREIAEKNAAEQDLDMFVPIIDDKVVHWNHTVSVNDEVILQQKAVKQELFGEECYKLEGHHRRVPPEDPDYMFDKGLAAKILRCLMANDTIMMVGATGCGKSSLIAQLAHKMNWPVSKVNLHGETTATDFVGTWVIEGKEMKYKYGVLPTAMKEGHILILEEIDAAEPSILFALQGVTEEDGHLILAENGGEVIHPHPLFRIISTANTLGRGDETGMYTGTHILNESQLDRWKVVFQMDYLHHMREAKLLNSKYPSLEFDFCQDLVKLANRVREAAKNDEVYCTFSTRRLLALAQNTERFGFEEALDLTVLNKLSDNDRKVVRELAQRIIPNTPF